MGFSRLRGPTGLRRTLLLLSDVCASTAFRSVSGPAAQKRQRLLETKEVTTVLHDLDLDEQIVAGPVIAFPQVNPSAAASALKGAWRVGEEERDAFASLPPTEGWTARVPFAPLGGTVSGKIASASWRRREITIHAGDVRVIDPGPHSVEARCTHYGQCGGCPWQSTSYDAQLAAKARHVSSVFEEAFGRERWLQLGPAVTQPPIPSSELYGYRNRGSFNVGRRQWLPSREDATSPAAAPVFIGYHPSKHLVGPGGNFRLGKGKSHPATDAAGGDATTSEIGDSNGRSPCAVASSDGTRSSASSSHSTSNSNMGKSSRDSSGGVWDKILQIDHCHLLPPSASAILRAAQSAAQAWEANRASGSLSDSDAPLALPDALLEVSIRSADAACPATIDAASVDAVMSSVHQDSEVFQLLLRWATPEHAAKFQRYIDDYLMPRILSAGTCGPVVSVISLSFPTSVPRKLIKQWDAEEKGKRGYAAGYKVKDVLIASAITSAIQQRTTEYLSGFSCVHRGASKLLKRYALASSSAAAGSGSSKEFLTLAISPRAFVQPSDSGGEAIMRELARVVNEARNSIGLPAATAAGSSSKGRPFIAWDLYCGTGALGLSVAKQGLIDQLIGIELDGSAVSDARINARINGLNAIARFGCADLNSSELLTDDVAEGLRGGDDAAGLPHPLPRPDIVILDPPRAGLHPRVVSQLLRHIRPRFVAYVSCKPSTQARDVAALCCIKSGFRFRLRSLTPIDQYPHTAHIEAVALLEADAQSQA